METWVTNFDFIIVNLSPIEDEDKEKGAKVLETKKPAKCWLFCALNENQSELFYGRQWVYREVLG